MKKLADFERTVNNLQEILEESGNSIVRDAAIKRYELCYELAWKSIQEAMRELGLEVCNPRVPVSSLRFSKAGFPIRSCSLT